MTKTTLHSFFETRCSCCIICRARLDCPLLSPPRVDLQRRWQQVGIISLSHVCWPTLCWRWSSTLCVRHAWSVVTASKNGPVAITRVDFDYQLHQLITFDSMQDIIAVLPWLYVRTLRSTQAWSKMNRGIWQNNIRISKVGKRIRIWMFYLKFEFLNFI